MSVTLTNARILTMDAGMTEIASGWLRVEGDRIAGMGEGTPDPAGEVVDLQGDLLMPGMVNPHCHMAMTLFRGLAEDVDDRLFRYILPMERDLVRAPAVRAGSRLAAAEMIRAGVTCVADMYYFEDQVGEVLAASGLRGIVGQTLGDFAAPDHAGFDEGFARAEALVERFRDHPRVTPSIAPHAPYSTDIPVMARVADWAAAKGVPVQIHLAETDAEVDWAARSHGCRPVEVARRAGLLAPNLIAAHCLHVDGRDAALLAEAGVGVAHCARANAKAGRGIAPVTALRAAGCAVGIGTDGPMSGNTLDLFAQMAPVVMLQNIAGHSRAALRVREAVRMATIEGARALKMEDRIGSLEVGKQADLIRVSLTDPRVQPVHDPYAALVYACGPQDVRDVMVAGAWLMRDCALLTIELPQVLADAEQVAATFRARVT